MIQNLEDSPNLLLTRMKWPTQEASHHLIIYPLSSFLEFSLKSYFLDGQPALKIIVENLYLLKMVTFVIFLRYLLGLQG